MASELDSFIYEWGANIRRVLERQLDSLHYDLDSDDEEARRKADHEIPLIRAWLFPPADPLTASEKERKVQAVANDPNLSTEERLVKIGRAARSTGRKRGRPKTDTARHAISALSLHLATHRSWREIALIVGECNHSRPNPSERSCTHCGDKIRDAVGHLETFLNDIGCHPELPRGTELDSMSLAELKHLFAHLQKVH